MFNHHYINLRQLNSHKAIMSWQSWKKRQSKKCIQPRYGNFQLPIIYWFWNLKIYINFLVISKQAQIFLIMLTTTTASFANRMEVCSRCLIKISYFLARLIAKADISPSVNVNQLLQCAKVFAAKSSVHAKSLIRDKIYIRVHVLCCRQRERATTLFLRTALSLLLSLITLSTP